LLSDKAYNGFVCHSALSCWDLKMKRFFDLSIALVALIALSPVVILVAILVYLNLGRPVFFIQQRPGFKGEPFYIYKFRTMLNPSSDGLLHKGDAERMTRFGWVLRRSSLDEIPQLWNVVRGDMSLIGPRPLLMEYLPLYNERQGRRHEVRPGITGWAQVNGRNNMSWQTKFEFDVWYVENQSLLLDMKILLLTIKKVFLREGVASPGHATSEPFEGNDQKKIIDE
jgi:lipopolysaccharide/colanic/teichoic acid biosynthesis glycosyltransferase